MPSIKVIIGFFGVLAVAYLIKPSQTNPLDAVIDTFDCIRKVTSALSSCEQKLQDRLDLIDKGEEQAGVKIDKSMFTCCYFAEFSHCLDTSTEGKCGKDISKAISSGASSVAKTLNSKCQDYEYYSPTCLFVVYLNIILIVIVVLALISVASCVIGCLRRR